MKKLTLLFLLIAYYCSAQMDFHTTNTLMESWSERSVVYNDHQEAIVDAQSRAYSKPVSFCNMWCTQFDEIENLEVIVKPSFTNSEGNSNGSISGKVIDRNSKESLLFASVALYKNDLLLTGTEADLDGNYKFCNLAKGVYDTEVSYVGYQTNRLVNISVCDKSIFDLELEESFELDSMLIVTACTPLINYDAFTPEVDKNKLSTDMQIIDADSKEALIGVTALFCRDGELVKGVSSDIDGGLKTPVLEDGFHQLKLSYVGYEPLDTLIDLSGMNDFVFEMEPAQNVITEIVILAYKMPMVIGCTTTCGGVTYVDDSIASDSLSMRESLIDESLSDEEIMFKVYPNPASDFTRIELETDVDQLLITNATGQIILKINDLHEGEHEVLLTDIMPGTYFVSMVAESRVATGRLVVVN